MTVVILPALAAATVVVPKARLAPVKLGKRAVKNNCCR